MTYQTSSQELEDRIKRQEASDFATASMALEGIKLSPWGRKIEQLVLDGFITADEEKKLLEKAVLIATVDYEKPEDLLNIAKELAKSFG